MRWFLSPKPKIGDIVVSIDARGYMATDWRIRWIGKIWRISEGNIPVASCEVLSIPGYRIGKLETALCHRLTRVDKGVWQEVI